MNSAISYQEPWYRFFKYPYHGKDPCLFDTKELPWITLIEDNANVIRAEMLEIAEGQRQIMKPYRFHKPQSSLYEWQTIPFLSWKYRHHRNCSYAPKTTAILESIPNLVSASLSSMAPGAAVGEHQGDTNAIVRNHLGIRIPDGLPKCGFRVCQEKRGWEEGKMLPFCDAKPHEAWNKTEQERIIMIIDVIRPEYANIENDVCATVIATQLLHMWDSYMPFHQRASPKALQRLIQPVKGLLKAGLPLQRSLQHIIG